MTTLTNFDHHKKLPQSVTNHHNNHHGHHYQCNATIINQWTPPTTVKSLTSTLAGNTYTRWICVKLGHYLKKINDVIIFKVLLKVYDHVIMFSTSYETNLTKKCIKNMFIKLLTRCLIKCLNKILYRWCTNLKHMCLILNDMTS